MAKKTAVAKGGNGQGGLKAGDGRAIHYYTAPDGTRVEEIFHHPEPKNLSKAGKWLRDHPNGYEGEVYINWEAVLK
jgi:hypothetical protein